MTSFYDHEKSEKSKIYLSMSTKKSLHDIIRKSLGLYSEYYIQVPTLPFINCENLGKKFNLSKLFSLYLKK